MSDNKENLQENQTAKDRRQNETAAQKQADSKENDYLKTRMEALKHLSPAAQFGEEIINRNHQVGETSREGVQTIRSTAKSAMKMFMTCYDSKTDMPQFDREQLQTLYAKFDDIDREAKSAGGDIHSLTSVVDTNAHDFMKKADQREHGKNSNGISTAMTNATIGNQPKRSAQKSQPSYEQQAKVAQDMQHNGELVPYHHSLGKFFQRFGHGVKTFISNFLD